MSLTDPLLSVRGLTAAFRDEEGWREVVQCISFDLHAGETLAIVGESGSGKSVTAMSILRLLDPRASRIAGEVRLAGRDLLALPEKEMRKVRGNEIAMVFQEPMTSLNPVFTVGKQIGEVLRRHARIRGGEARAETIRLMERVRIPDAPRRVDEYPHQFSGGMRQRVMIAMALASRPRLLIADEPTTALDVTIQGQILELIRELQEETGMGLLFITHDMGVVAEIAGRMLVMRRGEKVEEGPTTEVFAAATHPYTRALLAAVPRLGEMEGEPFPLRFPVVDPTTGATRAMPRPELQVDRTAGPILTVRNLSARFRVGSDILGRATGEIHAVEDVSFELRRGETLALVGESGCGKSTTGRSILRLVEPRAGEIEIDGYDVRTLAGRELRRMRASAQMIFQDPFSSLNPVMTVGATIAEPLLKHGLATRADAPRRVAELLRLVGLTPEMAGRFPHEFSGGQRQRIAIARVVALEPKMIVADESVSALDVSIKAQVCNLLMDLQQKLDIAYLFISHDMAVVERVSHRVAVMYLGEIVEIGPRAEVFGNPRHPYTKRLIAAVPIPDPSRRGRRPEVTEEEPTSPVRPLDYVAPEARYREVGPGHLVIERT